MKSFLLAILCLGSCFTQGAVIVTPGRIEVQAALEGDRFLLESTGETLDFLTFEVATPTSVRLVATRLSGTVFLAVGRIYEPGLLENATPDYRIFHYGPQQLTLSLIPGLYAIQSAVTAYDDIAPTFVPVNNTSDIISTVNYSYYLEGNMRGLEFLEGNRNGTFTVTQVPEPSAAWLMVAAIAFGAQAWHRQRP